MSYKILVDLKNSDRFDIEVPTEEIARGAMLRIKNAVESKTDVVSVTEKDAFVVSEIVGFSYEEVKPKSFWVCLK